MKTVAIVGRPNVGKSAFFNRLTQSRKALVHDLSGVTRDRLYGEVDWRDLDFTIVDTGGLEPGSADVIKNHIEEQVAAAVEESAVILFLVDGKTGLHPLDEFIAEYLRKSCRCPVLLVVNKVDDEVHSPVCGDFYGMGYSEVYWASATHGLNIGEILDRIHELLTEAGIEEELEDEFGDVEIIHAVDDSDLPEELQGEGLTSAPIKGALKVAVVGRPNVGKSSLINHLIEEKRLIVDDQPGTTRGPVDVPFSLDEREVVLIDTAGIKKRHRKDNDITRLCSAVARGAIKRAHICIQVIDCTLGVVSQDKHIAGEVADLHRACIIAVNKWDLMDQKDEARKKWEKMLKKQFRFLPHATTVYMSAKTGRGVKGLMERLAHVADCCHTVIPTGRLNEMLREAQLIHQAPMRKGGKRLKIFFAVQIRNKPGTFAFVVNDPKLVHFSFERYIENSLRKAADFTGVPIRFIYRERKRKPKGPKRKQAPGEKRKQAKAKRRGKGESK